MRVGLNATCLNDRPSGARQRFQGIYGALIRRSPNVEFVVYEPSDCAIGKWFAGAANVSARSTPIPSQGRFSKVLRGAGYWPRQLSEERLDIFECFNEPLVTSSTGRTFTTIHDIRGLHSNLRHVYTMSLRRTLQKVDVAITVSESMKSEILAFHPSARVAVIHNALDPTEFSSVSDDDAELVRRKFALPSEFLLAVGHFEPRKNYLRLVESLGLLRDRGCDCHLVIVGNDSGQRSLVEQKIASDKLTSHVTILSGLSDHEVRCMYRMSSLLVFASSYEGFGIPILEAMAAGIPMVTSDIPVFKEITEGQGVYFSPSEVDGISDAIQRTLESSADRANLVRYGRDRVRDFSVDRVSEQLASLYSGISG